MKYKLLTLLLLICIAACHENNCTMQNSVYCRYAFVDSETGTATTLQDTLTIRTTQGKLLLNRAFGIDIMGLPVSYTQSTDTLLLQFTSETSTTNDTLKLSHTNTPHFESLECGTSYFHKITAASINSRKPSIENPTAIDSIVIVNPTVNYDERTNLHIYLHTLH